MPCLSSSADSDLNESIRVSNAESQLALPFRTTTVFGSSVICSPNGSAVCTGAAAGGAGVSAVAGGVAGAVEGLAVEGLALGAGAGVAGAAGAGVAGVLAAGGTAVGDCASAHGPDEIAAIGISATMARRKKRGKFIQHAPWPYQAVAPRQGVPVHLREEAAILAREAC